jgi:ribonuclease HI
VTRIPIDEEDPIHIRQSNELVAVSDGSVDPMTGKAAYNWRITNSKGMGKITRSCFLHANPKYADSYFAELSGLNDLVRWINEAGLHHKSIVIGCDNKACVDLLSSTYISLTDLDREQGDLLRNTKMILQEFDDVRFEWVRVRGHQDDAQKYEDLPLIARLNIECDKAAKECMRGGTIPPTRAQPLPGHKSTLYLSNNMVTSKINEQIQ